MTIQATRFRALPLAWVVLFGSALFGCVLAAAQAAPNQPSQNRPTTVPGAEYSGMYSFLRDGEFVQVTVEQGRVTGFVSRYGDSESDRGDFLDHFFKSGKLDGNQLVFATEVVHGISFEFHGTIERGEGKNRGDEAFYILKGTLTEKSMDAAKKISAHAHEVALKSFPLSMDSPGPGNK